LDVNTSFTILKDGDWFYKWNAEGTSVHPRWVFLDVTRFFFAWGKRETSDATFCGKVKVESLRQVNTSQVVEYDDFDTPRVFYVITIATTERELRLATEMREKVNIWYDALKNVIAYYRRLGGTMLQSVATGD
jgi:hypothetical protein